MAYRRKQSMPRNATFAVYNSPPAVTDDQLESPSPSLAAQAIRASSAHRDSSLSSAYGESAFSSAYRESNRQRPSPDSTAYEYTSFNSLHETKHGFWGVLARKAKAIIEENNVARQFEDHGWNWPQTDESTGGQGEHYRSTEGSQKTDNPIFQKGSEFASSLNYIGGTIKNALEEGRTIVENRTADIIQETRKLQIRRKSPNQATDVSDTQNASQSQASQETQLKASRDVASAMAAKAKLLLRELKTVKADLAFTKERCTQLEEENKILRENRQKGANHEDEDLIRLQLETLLDEKGRLAHENSVYARENRFLREVVEYHQLTMQDVVYLEDDDEDDDECTEEATETNSIHIPSHSLSKALRAASPGLSNPSTPRSVPATPKCAVLSNVCSVDVMEEARPLQSPKRAVLSNVCSVDVMEEARPLQSPKRAVLSNVCSVDVMEEARPLQSPRAAAMRQQNSDSSPSLSPKHHES